MSAPSLPDILARLAAATPGPWHRMTVPDGDPIDGPTGEDRLTNCIGAAAIVGAETFIADADTDADADLIAHAPGDLAALAARVAELEAENAALRAEAILRGGGEVPPGWGRFPGHTEAEPFFRQIIDADHWRYCLLVDVREGGSIDWEVSRSYCAHREIVDRGDEPSRSILKAMAAAEACFTAATEATP